ncbi:MAG TPA: CHRD domain-containing protein [Nitrososphaeraceae archaeon]
MGLCRPQCKRNSTTIAIALQDIHIHQGKNGENGPPKVMLSMGKGKITPGNLQGPLTGEQLSDLAKLMQDRNTNVNVHTQQNQNGEIRGQISGS